MIKWYHWILFGLVAVAALCMSWYSMTDLAHNGFNVPWILAAITSLVFDIGAIFLALMAIEYAKTADSGFWTELSAFLFILTSVYINVYHADWSNYGLVGMVMFGAAPIVTGIVLKVILSFLTRQARRDAGRVLDKLPSVGILTWMRYRQQTWRLMSVVMQKRLIDAASKLDIAEDRHKIFVGQATVAHPAIESAESDAEILELTRPTQVSLTKKRQEILPRTEQDINEIVYVGEIMSIPAWLPQDPKMSLAKLASICIENGQKDVNTILSWARTIKHSDVKYDSVYKAVLRARQTSQ